MAKVKFTNRAALIIALSAFCLTGIGCARTGGPEHPVASADSQTTAAIVETPAAEPSKSIADTANDDFVQPGSKKIIEGYQTIDGIGRPVTVTFQVADIQRGDKALAVLQSSNTELSQPSDGMEYIIVTMYITYDEGEPDVLDLSENNASLASERRLFALSNGDSNAEPMTSALNNSIYNLTIKKGESKQGAVAFLHKADSTEPLTFIGFGNVIKFNISNELSEKSGETDGLTYEMKLYTEASNENSSVKIQYPVFSGNKAEEVNSLILTKVQDIAYLDSSLFPQNTKYTCVMQASVTLINSKIASMVFWGTYDIEGSQFPTTNLYSINIDLNSLKPVALHDLYVIDEEFEKIFFEKAFFPANPVTSYSESEFPEMLKIQTSEYNAISPFTYSDNMDYFLKPEGIVLSMPAVHASGSDHFEAELLYDVIQENYLPEQIYWKE